MTAMLRRSNTGKFVTATALSLGVLTCASNTPKPAPAPAPTPAPVSTARLDDQGRPYPPSPQCGLGPDKKWRPELAELCRVPWEDAQPWPTEGARVELDGARGRGGHVRILLEEVAAEWGAQFDVPWAVLPDGTGMVAGNLRVLDGPDGERACPGPAPTHALRLRSFGAFIEIGIPLSGECAVDPPVYTGVNAIVWERPLPSGGAVDTGPAPAWFSKGRGDRPPEVPAACVDKRFHLDELRLGGGRCPLDFSSARAMPGPDQLAFEAAPLSGRSGSTLDFEVTYRNITDAPLIVDLQLSARRPLWAGDVLRDGAPVTAPDRCVIGGFLEQGEAHRVSLLPGGAITLPARAVLVPSGFALMKQERGCDLDLEPGSYELRVPAPDSGRRSDSVSLQVTR